MREMKGGNCTDDGCVLCDVCEELGDYRQCCWCVGVSLPLSWSAIWGRSSECEGGGYSPGEKGKRFHVGNDNGFSLFT